MDCSQSDVTAAPVRIGEVVEFDPVVGLGALAGGVRFHLIEIVDGTRSVRVGEMVAWTPKARFGSFEASQLVKVAAAKPGVAASSG